MATTTTKGYGTGTASKSSQKSAAEQKRFSQTSPQHSQTGPSDKSRRVVQAPTKKDTSGH